MIIYTRDLGIKMTMNKYVSFERRFSEIEKDLKKHRVNGKPIDKILKNYAELQEEYDSFILDR